MNNIYKTETAVVILNWNGKKHLETFLPSVCQHSKGEGVKIFIADNGSTDDSVDFLKKYFPEAELIEFEENYGFAGGYNKALQQIEADFYVILNSDIEVSSGWLDAPITILKQEERTAAVTPKILSYTDKSRFEYAGAAGGFIDKYGYPFCRGRIINTIENDKGQYDDECSVFWASGAALFVNANIFKEVGGFDSDFFAHMEEIDLCWRMKNRAYEIKYTPKSVVWHLGGGALPKEHPFKTYLNHRNNLMMLYKNLPANKVFLTILKRLFLDGLSAIVYLAALKVKFFVALLKAHYAFYRSLRHLKAKRKNVVKETIQNNHSEIYEGSIIFDFFIRKKKTFDELNF
jgi:GT2 family glycosyltransferase